MGKTCTAVFLWAKVLFCLRIVASYESARYADYNMLMVLCMITGVTVIFCNMIGQIINEHIDPRIKAAEVVEDSEVKII